MGNAARKARKRAGVHFVHPDRSNIPHAPDKAREKAINRAHDAGMAAAVAHYRAGWWS